MNNIWWCPQTSNPNQQRNMTWLSSLVLRDTCFKVSTSLVLSGMDHWKAAPEASGHCWWLRIVTFATLGWSLWMFWWTDLNTRLSVHTWNAVSKFRKWHECLLSLCTVNGMFWRRFWIWSQPWYVSLQWRGPNNVALGEATHRNPRDFVVVHMNLWKEPASAPRKQALKTCWWRMNANVSAATGTALLCQHSPGFATLKLPVYLARRGTFHPPDPYIASPLPLPTALVQ